MKLTIHPKVASPLVVGALVGIIVTEAGRHGITIDGGEASNLTMVLMFLAGVLAPDDGSKLAEQPPPSMPELSAPMAAAVALAKPKG